MVAEVNGQLALFEQDGKDKIFSHQYIVLGFRPEIKIGKGVSIPITVGINAVRPTQITNRSISLNNIFPDKSYYFQSSFYASAGLQLDL